MSMDDPVLYALVAEEWSGSSRGAGSQEQLPSLPAGGEGLPPSACRGDMERLPIDQEPASELPGVQEPS